jgi:Raf kinase inhibitor-like YbhB/YbcL family protein
MQTQTISVVTDAIGKEGRFDPRYTCDLDNSSPELRWEGAPANTAGFALVAEDLDAPNGIFTHWIIYNIPAGVHHLPAGIPPQESLPNGIRQGINSLGKLGYSGPCPPHGDRAHRYFFRILALSRLPNFSHRIQRDQFLKSIEPFILATGEITGIYQKMIQRAG